MRNLKIIYHPGQFLFIMLMRANLKANFDHLAYMLLVVIVIIDKRCLQQLLSF